MPTIPDPLISSPQRSVFDLTRVDNLTENATTSRSSSLQIRRRKIARVPHRVSKSIQDETISRFATPGGAVKVPPHAIFPKYSNYRKNMSILTFLKNEEVQQLLKKVSVCMQSCSDRRDRQLKKQRQYFEQLMEKVQSEEQRSVARSQLEESTSQRPQIDSCLRRKHFTVSNTNIARGDIQPQPPKEVSAHPSFIRNRKPPGGYFHIDAIVSRVCTESKHNQRDNQTLPKLNPDFIKLNSDIRTPLELEHEKKLKKQSIVLRTLQTEQKRVEYRNYIDTKNTNRIKRWQERRDAVEHELISSRRGCGWSIIIALLSFGKAASKCRKKNIVLTFISIIMLKVVCSRRLCRFRLKRLRFLSGSLCCSLQWSAMIARWRKRRATAKINHFLKGIKSIYGPLKSLHLYRMKLRHCTRFINSYVRMRNAQLSLLRLKWERSLLKINQSDAVTPFSVTPHVRDNVLKCYLKDRSSFIRMIGDDCSNEDPLGIIKVRSVALIPSDTKMQRMIVEAKQQQDIARALLQ